MRSRYNGFELSQIISILSLLPLLLGISPAILDQIDLVAIRQLQLRSEGGRQILETTVTIRNTSQQTLKFEQGECDVAFVTNAAEDVKLGQIRQDVILLEQKDRPTLTDTELVFAFELGSNAEVAALFEKVRATTDALLQASPLKIKLHLQARFNLAIKADKGCDYLNEVEIDWILAPEIERTVFENFLQTIAHLK